MKLITETVELELPEDTVVLEFNPDEAMLFPKWWADCGYRYFKEYVQTKTEWDSYK